MRTTKLVSSGKFPTLSAAVPVYDLLMDKIEHAQSLQATSPELKAALTAGMEKLKLYYARSDDSSMYAVATSKPISF